MLTADLHADASQASGVGRPVIIELCCSLESQVGNVQYLGGGNKTHIVLGCRVVRITKEDCDVTMPGGAERAPSIARDNPGALLLTSLTCTAGCPC